MGFPSNRSCGLRVSCCFVHRRGPERTYQYYPIRDGEGSLITDTWYRTLGSMSASTSDLGHDPSDLTNLISHPNSKSYMEILRVLRFHSRLGIHVSAEL